jgi:hypothetical protein
MRRVSWKKGDTSTVPLEHLVGLDPVTRVVWRGYHR